jgi:glycerophosphoryl diester phosphodiesterase
MRPLLLVCLLTATAIGWAAEPKSVQPLAHAHAHNDYEHTRPLFDALDRGFCSVEADIWLADGALLVAHDKQYLKPARTLQSLYLDPLRDRTKANGGRVYRDGPPFYLLIDVKTEAEKTYAALDKVLAQYADILTVRRDGKTQRKAVTAILSGNRAAETIGKQAVRYVGIDGRPDNLDTNPPADLYPWISANWTLLFKWNGAGAMPAEEKEKLRALVKRAHDQGRQIRFWSTAENAAMWKELLAAGVDLINTDKLAELQKLLVENPR